MDNRLHRPQGYAIGKHIYLAHCQSFKVLRRMLLASRFRTPSFGLFKSLGAQSIKA
ncbi:hypothetical protein M407DRAFT_241189 [Tulasnella calospora MUT 4182]|uniref:Uncharacterized protein n=1 Tax=Tulasnella calospora MUT 4182 TaxID=1051891 RepID=A0A0C3QU88_9AGAM|nr:hypothetical protein M407DRAFT_241189 [Tulasnella calospora MUT 4182]